MTVLAVDQSQHSRQLELIQFHQLLETMLKLQLSKESLLENNTTRFQSQSQLLQAQQLKLQLNS